MRIVTDSQGRISFLPDEPIAAPVSIAVAVDTTTLPAESTTATESDQPITENQTENQPQSDSPAVSQNQFMILRTYGHMSSEDLFMTHYNREKSRASEMSDDDLLQSIAELELIVQIGKIRQRAVDDVRLERIESKHKTAKEKQKLSDAGFKVKRREILDSESAAKAEADKKAKSKSTDIDKLVNFAGMTREEAEAFLAKKKS